jgi:hypothetical protein
LFAAAFIYLVNIQGTSLLDSLLANLPEHVRYRVSRTEWRGFTTVVPQILVATKPVALTIQVDSNSAADEVADLVKQWEPKVDAAALREMARCQTRLDLMAADTTTPRIDEKNRTLTIEATTTLDPKTADVDAVISALLDLTDGFAVDAVHDRLRPAAGEKWISAA